MQMHVGRHTTSQITCRVFRLWRMQFHPFHVNALPPAKVGQNSLLQSRHRRQTAVELQRVASAAWGARRVGQHSVMSLRLATLLARQLAQTPLVTANLQTADLSW